MSFLKDLANLVLITYLANLLLIIFYYPHINKCLFPNSDKR